MSHLHRAARLGTLDEVAVCLARGENVNARSVHHYSPLMLAARGGHLPVVLLLLDAGANVRLVHPDGRTALHFAAEGGHLNIVQTLLVHGAPVNGLTADGCSPAILAARADAGAVVSLLKSAGANLALEDRQGRTVRDWLAEDGVRRCCDCTTSEWFAAHRQATDHDGTVIRGLMADGLSADEYAARHGRHILVWKYGGYRFDDRSVEQWAGRVAEVLFTPELLAQCEERFLHGPDLEDARKLRRRRERQAARRRRNLAVRESEADPEMTLAALTDLLRRCEAAGIPLWLDGGWGVDALLREQTRRHRDVDVILSLPDVPRLEAVLAGRGFTVREGTPPHSFVLADGAGLEVDVHAVTFDAEGNGAYRMQNGAEWIYPAAGFGGQGYVGAHRVRCLSPEVQILCHAHGYVPIEKDFRDMALLAGRFGLGLPPKLRKPG